MSVKELKKKSEGFTIIEVLIVLAIAGLILLIVFLAVPALQRNSRNTQAKNEASSILGAVNEYTTNNNGKVLTTGDSDTATTDAAKVKANVKLVNITKIVVEAQATGTDPSDTTAVIALNAKCSVPTGSDLGTNITAAGNNSRQYALVYQIETGSGKVAACQEG